MILINIKISATTGQKRIAIKGKYTINLIDNNNDNRTDGNDRIYDNVIIVSIIMTIIIEYNNNNGK